MKTLTLAKVSIVSLAWFAAPVFAALPYASTNPAVKNAKYTDYCLGSPTQADIPKPNFKSEAVLKALAKLNVVAKESRYTMPDGQTNDLSFYYYKGPMTVYGLSNKKLPVDVPADMPPDTEISAYNFLALLCGEFRDRPSMIAAKLRWVHRLEFLPDDEQQVVDYQKLIRENASIWSVMSSKAYEPFIRLSEARYYAYQNSYWNDPKTKTKIGKITVDKHVPAISVCEAKYMLGEYVAKKREFTELKPYLAGFNYEFKKKSCTTDDLKHYYNFRGDSNFKPNSPESNAMIWYANSISSGCKSPTEAKEPRSGETAKVTSEMCANYFKTPFASRWNASVGGLGTWLFHVAHKAQFAESWVAITVLPTIGAKFSKPFPYKLDDMGVVDAFNKSFDINKPDLGYNAMTGLGTGKADLELAYSRIRNSLNRHTDWYSSRYDDGIGMVRDQAYSPFVASSYDPSASDGFTSPGATVASQSDGKKHWMFVFKVKAQNWYNVEALAQKRPIDFNTMWLDETTFGDNGLADSERAWDRLGTAVEDELDSILYLHNINANGLYDYMDGEGDGGALDAPSEEFVDVSPSESVPEP